MNRIDFLFAQGVMAAVSSAGNFGVSARIKLHRLIPDFSCEGGILDAAGEQISWLRQWSLLSGYQCNSRNLLRKRLKKEI